MTTSVQILRMRQLRAKYPRGRSTIYADIAAGLMTPPVPLGRRCVGWPAHEIDQIITARMSGAEEPQIRELVTRLVAERRPTIPSRRQSR
jgi:predicted DNA-binding transcriptional regulator AlpA